jgi:hypothetical protein
MAKAQKKREKEEMEIYSRGLISYKFMPGRPSLPGYFSSELYTSYKANRESINSAKII